MLGTGKREWHRTRARCDQHMPGFERLSFYFDRGRCRKSCRPVEGVDAALSVAPLVIGRDRISERPFESDQIGPANRCLTRDAPPAHSASHVHRFRAANEHLLRVATPQGTGAPERQMVDNSDRPSRRPKTRACDLCSGAAADDDETVCFNLAHERSLFLPLVSAQVAAAWRR